MARAEYLYRVVVDEAPAGNNGSVDHPDAEEVWVGMGESSSYEIHPAPLPVPANLPAPVRNYQSLAAAKAHVATYGRAGCTAHHERSNPITWPTPKDTT